MINQLRVEQHQKSSKQVPRMVAKNIIIFVGDGMGMTTITAGRIFKGQLNGTTGESTNLEFDRFPHIGMSRVNHF